MFFEHRVNTRLRQREIDLVDELIKRFPNDFENRSHVIRIALIRFLKENLGEQALNETETNINLENIANKKT